MAPQRTSPVPTTRASSSPTSTATHEPVLTPATIVGLSIFIVYAILSSVCVAIYCVRRRRKAQRRSLLYHNGGSPPKRRWYSLTTPRSPASSTASAPLVVKTETSQANDKSNMFARTRTSSSLNVYTSPYGDDDAASSSDEDFTEPHSAVSESSTSLGRTRNNRRRARTHSSSSVGLIPITFTPASPLSPLSALERTPLASHPVLPSAMAYPLDMPDPVTPGTPVSTAASIAPPVDSREASLGSGVGTGSSGNGVSATSSASKHTAIPSIISEDFDATEAAGRLRSASAASAIGRYYNPVTVVGEVRSATPKRR